METIKNLEKKSFNITKIENMTEEQAVELAREKLEIKGHNVYLIDFPGYFGYSACVFCNGHHIHYANDYELHHKGRDREWLRNWYIDTLNRKLYTEEELQEPVKTYDDYESKRYFLQNYYGMREDHISAFRIATTEEKEKEFERSVKDMFYNPVCYAYYNDREFVQKCVKLHVDLMNAKNETLDNFEWWKDAFYREMCNHEYGINWQADYDTLSAFGNPKWRHDESKNTLGNWFKDLKFKKVQKEAYLAAREMYYKKANENGWY